MIGETNFERVVGGTKQEQEEAAQVLQEFFEGEYRKLADNQIEKSPEDLEILKATESMVDEIVTEYGGTPKAVLDRQIYLLKPGGTEEATDGKFLGGVCSPFSLKIGVDRDPSDLLFACNAAHELFHLKSYKSARVGETLDDVELYRSGLSLIGNKESDKGKEYFKNLEEAVVAECAKKFYQKAENNILFKDDIEALKKIGDLLTSFCRDRGVSEEIKEKLILELKYIPNPQEIVKQVMSSSNDEEKRKAYFAGMISSMWQRNKVELFERSWERKELYKLLDELIEKSNGKYENRDQLFTEFAKANFSGNYLPLARIVEDILGAGSFRKIAEDFKRE